MKTLDFTPEFEEVYRRTYRRIFAFSRKLCRNSEEAEDIAQEAFVRALSAFHTFNRESQVENWLMRIAYNVFLDHRRRQRRRITACSESELGEDRFMDSIPDPRAAADQGIERQALDAELVQALDCLPHNTRDLLRLAYQEELSYAEIAERLGVNIETVRSRLHRACVKVQQLVEQRRTRVDRLRVA